MNMAGVSLNLITTFINMVDVLKNTDKNRFKYHLS